MYLTLMNCVHLKSVKVYILPQLKRKRKQSANEVSWFGSSLYILLHMHTDVQAHLGDIAGVILDHHNKANIEIK